MFREMGKAVVVVWWLGGYRGGWVVAENGRGMRKKKRVQGSKLTNVFLKDLTSINYYRYSNLVYQVTLNSVLVQYP